MESRLFDDITATFTTISLYLNLKLMSNRNYVLHLLFDPEASQRNKGIGQGQSNFTQCAG